MDLRSRLAALKPPTASEEVEENTVVSSFRERMERLRVQHAEASGYALEPLRDQPGAMVVGEGEGSFIRIERPLSGRVGEAARQWVECWHPARTALVGRDARLAEVDPRRALFLDTETTGLGGAGAIVFLIGGVHLADGVPTLVQFVLPSPAAEYAYLEHFLAFVQRFDLLVTYNGRAFDIKALSDRFVLSRLREGPSVLERFPHLDLLFPARRIWRLAAANCRLLTLEREVLGRTRERDVEGFLIPSIYYRFLRTGRTDEMQNVLAHNEHDVISLLLMATVTMQMLADPHSFEDGERRFGERMLGLGTMLTSAGDADGGEAALRRSLSSDSAVTRYQARKHLAHLHKRRGQWRHAVALWQAMADEDCLGDIAPLLELAKYHEHRLRDYAGAAAWVKRAMDHPMARLASVSQSLQRRQLRLLHRSRRPDPLG